VISGYFPGEAPPHPYVDVAVRIGELSIEWVLVPFVVDTGAAKTSIHALDAIRRLGMSPADLDPSKWASSIQGTGVGGAVRYRTAAAEYGFHHDDGRWELVDGEVQIGELASHNQGIPSLLGWDLLQHFRLVTHGRDRTIVLERL